MRNAQVVTHTTPWCGDLLWESLVGQPGDSLCSWNANTGPSASIFPCQLTTHANATCLSQTWWLVCLYLQKLSQQLRTSVPHRFPAPSTDMGA